LALEFRDQDFILEPSADVIASAAASLAVNCGRQRTSVIKVCMLNNYFLLLSGLKFEENKKYSNKNLSNKRMQNQAGCSTDSKFKYQQQLMNSRCMRAFHYSAINWVMMA